jgi:hypothetical protein
MERLARIETVCDDVRQIIALPDGYPEADAAINSPCASTNGTYPVLIQFVMHATS